MALECDANSTTPKRKGKQSWMPTLFVGHDLVADLRRHITMEACIVQPVVQNVEIKMYLDLIPSSHIPSTMSEFRFTNFSQRFIVHQLFIIHSS